MQNETRLQIVEHACRWSMNMIAEVCNNHATILDSEARQELRNACRSLANAFDLVRAAQK
jgi:hypothetical protein